MEIELQKKRLMDKLLIPMLKLEVDQVDMDKHHFFDENLLVDKFSCVPFFPKKIYKR